MSAADGPERRARGESPSDAPCVVCSAPMRPTRASSGGTILYVCDRCGHGTLLPRPSAADLEAAYAEAYGEEGAKFHAPFERLLALGARQEARELAALLPPTCRRALDVGCGRGVLLQAMRELGVDAEGVERSAQAAAGGHGARVHIAAELRDALLPGAAYGLVVFRHVLEHLDDPLEALREARRLLVPGGSLVVEVPDRASLQARAFTSAWFHLDIPRHLHHFSGASLTRALDTCGFDVVSVGPGAVVQDVMGWLQSALHRLGRPHQGLYQGLHRGQRPQARDVLLGASLLPAVVCATAWERATGSAAAVRAIARPRPDA